MSEKKKQTLDALAKGDRVQVAEYVLVLDRESGCFVVEMPTGSRLRMPACNNHELVLDFVRGLALGEE